MSSTYRRHSLVIGLILLSLAVLIAIVGLHLLSGRATAGSLASVPPPWDKSSIELTGQCLPDGTAEFTVLNTGRDMAGSSAWREYEADVLTADGTFQLAAGAAQTWTFGPLPGVAIRFEADQRPGHPGSSQPKLTLTCQRPTAVALRTFTASTAGNRGGCGRGNMTIVTCNVSDAGPGFVSGDCEWGYWFSRVATRRTFRIGQIVTVDGCEGLNSELYAPITIRKAK